MAALKRVYSHRYLILLWSALELLFFSAITYGWAALVIVLKQEDFFHDLCQAKHERNSTCIEQDERLNLVFLSGVISFSATGVVSGAFLDRFGPRKTRLLSSFLFVLTFLFFVLADKNRPNLIFPGMITLSGAGVTLLMTLFQVANMFEKWKSSVISLFNGAVDSSAIVLLFFKLVHDSGVSFRAINIFYFLLAITVVLVFTFVLPPFVITSDRVNALNGDENDELSHDSCARDEVLSTEVAGESLVRFEGVERNGSKNVNVALEANGATRTPEKNGKLQQEIDLPSSPLCQVEDNSDDDQVQNVDAERRGDLTPRLTSLMTTAEYILVVLFLSICNLRLWFYVGNLNSYLEFMSDNDMDTVSNYTNWFGVVQFAGFFFAPIVGFVMDWKPKHKRNEETDLGFVFGFFLTSCVALLLNVLVLVPVLPVQYFTFVVQVVLRAFVYAVYAAFILHKFPLLHFGKLYGTGHLIAAVTGSIQYGLFSVAEDTLQKDPFWVNVSLLVLCLFLNVFPVYLWLKENKGKKDKRSGKRIVIR